MITTVGGLQTYLKNTTYDITVILITPPEKRVNPSIHHSLCAQHLILKQEPHHDMQYNLTYEYLILDSIELIHYYTNHVTSTIPYLVTYKKKYANREPWYPCKKADPNSTRDDLKVFYLYSLKN